MLRYIHIAVILIAFNANIMSSYRNHTKQGARTIHRHYRPILLGTGKRLDEFNNKNYKITNEYVLSEDPNSDMHMIEQVEQLCQEYPSVVEYYNTQQLPKSQFERKLQQELIASKTSL